MSSDANDDQRTPAPEPAPETVDGPKELEASSSDSEETGEAGEIVANDHSKNTTAGHEIAGALSAYKESLVKDNKEQADHSEAPPLPDEAPPLPEEAPPGTVVEDDGWAPVWEETAKAFYFYNRFTCASQWTNPRVPEATEPDAPALPISPSPLVPSEAAPARPAGGYDPAIHGDYDENAWYAQPALDVQQPEAASTDPAAAYTATAAFNRFTGRYQAAEITPENYNDENKSKRQMNAFFDVDAAANNHNGKSLKEERSGKKLSKQELKQFKEKRKAKKEEKRRAWLRD